MRRNSSAGTARCASQGFRDFALERYARPGAKTACLELQDLCAADVLVLLYLCWRAAGADRLDEFRLRALSIRAAALAQHLIAPLRAARRATASAARATGSAALLRAAERLKAAELRAEYLQLDWLARWEPPPAGEPDAGAAPQLAASSIAAYLGLVGVAPAEAETRAIEFSRALLAS